MVEEVMFEDRVLVVWFELVGLDVVVDFVFVLVVFDEVVFVEFALSVVSERTAGPSPLSAAV